MNIWSTFRLVPPLAPEAMAWATLSFATYLATSEYGPEIAGRPLDPLALALFVQLFLSMTKNIGSEKFARVYARNPRVSVAIPSAIFAALATVAVYASSATAAKLIIAYFLFYATLLFGVACYAPRRLHYLQGTWTNSKRARTKVVMIEASGLAVSAATLATTWVFADPMAFAAMMSFGVLVVRTLVNWVIVLYLLDEMQRGK
jgi:hypothetical protein